MQYKTQMLEAFTLVGISVRTNNKKAQTENDIAKLWECFFANEIINRIDNKLSNDIYCVYTNYESDFADDYTTFIGCVVSEANNISEDLSTLNVCEAKYFEFVSEGILPNCVLDTWNHIWDTDYNRAYFADFDVYDKDAQDPHNAKVKTYLSIL